MFHTELSTAFLILGLFIPRLVLLFSWITNSVPLNTVPFWGDFFLAAMVPRFLIAFYIYLNMGQCAWMWTYIVVGFFCLSSTSSSKSKD